MKRFKFLLPILILLWAFGLWSTRLSEPFVGRHDNNTAWMMIAGQNYLQYGYLDVGFVQIMDTDPALSEPTELYHHHPPLGSFLISVQLALFGNFELSARLVAMFITLVGAAAFYKLACRSFGDGIGLIALLLYLTVPMIAFYGQMVNHEPLVLSIFLLQLLVYHNWLKHPLPRLQWVLLGLTIVLAWSGWVAFFCAFALGVHAFFFAPSRWQVIRLLLAGLLIGVASWMLLAMLFMTDFWESLLDAFLVRSGITDHRLWDNLLDFLWQLGWTRARPRFTEALPILALIGASWLIWQWRTNRRTQTQRSLDAVWFIVLIPAFLQVFVFMQQTFVHDFLTYYFAPFLAVMGAVGIHWLWHNFQSQQRFLRWLYGVCLLILVGGFIASSIRWTWNLYQERDDFPTRISAEIQERIPSGTTLYSDIRWQPSIWMYSQRRILPLSQRPDDDTNVYQLHCYRDADGGELIQVAGRECHFFPPK